MRYFLAGAAVLTGIVGVVATARWIAIDANPHWSRLHRRYGRTVDQRWLCAIAVAVDAVYVAMGVAESADTTYWLGQAVIAGLQSIFIAATLTTVYARNKRSAIDRK